MGKEAAPSNMNPMQTVVGSGLFPQSSAKPLESEPRKTLTMGALYGLVLKNNC